MSSRYTLITGSFPIVGTEPDGDTIRFRPDDPAQVAALGPAGQVPAWSQGGTQINVRFEAIDALETHFAGTHQRLDLARLAADQMLRTVGFQAVTRDNAKVTAAEPESLRGWVAANSLDSYGRMIAFVYAGEAPAADGTPWFVDAPGLAASVNARLLEAGLAYPAFYTTLPVDLRTHLAAQVRVVRERAIGLWPDDAPSLDRPAEVPDLAAAQSLAMWPKLFRRLVSYFQSGHQGLGAFDAWLREDARQRDDYLQLPTGELGNMHDLLDIRGDRVLLRFRPEDLVVLPDTFVPPTPPAPTPAPAPGPTPGPTPAPAPLGGVRMIAALPNPDGPDAGRETVTLINTGADDVDLAGWQLRDRALQARGRDGTPLGGTLAAGEALRVVLQPPVALSNDGDELLLLDRDGAVVHRVAYTAGQVRKGLTLVFG